MKKFASLLLTVALLATMLTVFAVPASAEEDPNFWTEDKTLSDTQDISDYINALSDVTVAEDANITFKDTLILSRGKTLTVKSGATVVFNKPFTFTTLLLEDGASVIFNDDISFRGSVTIEGGGTVTCNNELAIMDGGTLTVKGGASVICNKRVTIPDGCTLTVKGGATVTYTDQLNVTENSTVTIESDGILAIDMNAKQSFTPVCTLNVYGILTGSCGEIEIPNIHIFPGGTVDLTGPANGDFIELLQSECPSAKYEKDLLTERDRLTAHIHLFDKNGTCCSEEYLARIREKDCERSSTGHRWRANGKCSRCGATCEHIWQDGKCTVCDYECPHHGSICALCGEERLLPENGAIGSVLSEGSLAIITAVAGIVVGMAVMFFIMKKKKPALAGGADNTDEE